MTTATITVHTAIAENRDNDYVFRGTKKDLCAYTGLSMGKVTTELKSLCSRRYLLRQDRPGDSPAYELMVMPEFEYDSSVIFHPGEVE